ncbi:hypothetical protein ACIRSS_23730 [Amycolatopsis sp. NPDC101161]|uniref:hypothetical protein n=1 Tax=Amycolatopsis sp. NPDC101161 TaxID=3363940 RepID=UPI0037F96B81
MTRRASLPAEDDVRAALDALRNETVGTTGRPPTVLALAQRVGLANSTFRRNFPAIVAEIIRSPDSSRKPDISRRDGTAVERLTEQNTRLRLTNRELTDQVALAMAAIQRLSLDNRQLRAELEAVCNVSRISTRPPCR